MTSTVFTMPMWIEVAIGIFGVAGSLASAWAIARQKAITASLSVITEANAELRKSNEDLRVKLDEEQMRRAELEGKLSVFVNDFAERIVQAVMETQRRFVADDN